jgi:hypothetical protein
MHLNSTFAILSFSAIVFAWHPYQSIYAREAASYDNDPLESSLFARGASIYPDAFDIYERGLDESLFDLGEHHRRAYFDTILQPRILRGARTRLYIQQMEGVLDRINQALVEIEDAAHSGTFGGVIMAEQ